MALFYNIFIKYVETGIPARVPKNIIGINGILVLNASSFLRINRINKKYNIPVIDEISEQIIKPGQPAIKPQNRQ